jgi:hypothetical protein
MLRHLLLSALLVATSASAGEGPDGTEGDEPGTAPASLGAATARSEGRDGFVLPFVFYTPDTRFGIGGTAGLHQHLRGGVRPSSLFATGIYTVEGQSALDFIGQLYPDQGHVFQGTARATHFPTAYWGVGPDTVSEARERFTQRYVELALAGERRLAAALRAGPRLHVRAEEITDREPGGELAAGDVIGADGYGALGVGAGITWDDRDGLFAPERGRFAELWYLAYPGRIGGHGPFGRAALDLRAFTSPWPGHVLGAQAYAEVAHGEAPFTLLPRFGGAHRMRGYPEGRYRDRAHYALQGEWRFPLFRRLGGAAFATAGDVAPRLNAFDLRDPKLSAGAGLRFRLTDEGAALRFDVAATRDGMSYYAIVLQAF